jgi:hypothetical protein
VWGATIAGLSDVGTIGGKLAQRMGDTASSIASLVNDHTDTVTGSLATTADVQNASSSVVALVNANTNSAVNGAWNVTLTDTQNVETGKTYKVKVYTKFAGNPTDSFAVPRITIKNVAEISVVNNDVMSDVGDGIYEYEYLAPIGAVQGSWETLVDVQVESLQYINVSDYWQVTGSPAQIIINSVSTTIPTITAEGLTGYEYQYEWCVVSDSNNACGGNDDIFHATAAKYVNSGTDFNTNITATVPTVGNYEFKAVVYFGTQSSRTSRSFTATVGTTPPQPLPGGGGGGGFINPTQPANPLLATFKKADFNVDGKVSSIDFSILMAFWNTKPPFKNIRVDITKDGKIDSVDFSILMYEWGS